jgi:lipopolysaccharide transport system permease protein
MINSSGGAEFETLSTGVGPSLRDTASISESAPEQRSDWPEPITIQRTTSWGGLNLKDLWIHRELLYFLTLRDLKVRYKQTSLGVAWVILQPLLMAALFTIILGKFAGIGSGPIPYVLFAYSGLVLWTFFSGALLNMGTSLVGNSHLITKVYFPRFIIPVATTLGRLVDLATASTVLGGLLLYYRVPITARLLAIPFVILLLVMLALAIGMWTAAINVKFRDVGLALPMLVQLWLFASPIVYPVSLVPGKWRFLYSLNPLVGIIGAFRAALFAMPFDWRAIGLSTVITLVLLMYAAYSFRSRERTFADVV